MQFLNKQLGDLLPETARTALTRLKKEPETYISDPQGKKISWEGHEHAIYLGKWPRPKSQKKSIYSDEVVLGLVDYVAAGMSPNKERPVRIVLGPQMSEWFNGENLGVGTPYLSPEEQKKYLESLIVQRLKLKRDQFDIVFWEEEERRQALLKPTAQLHREGCLDVRSSLSQLPDQALDVKSNDLSAQIAKRLLLAAEKNLELRREFVKTVPPGVTVSVDGDAELLPEAWGPEAYGLYEVAMRLADLLQNRPIQLGVERQGVYDAIIQKLLRYSKATKPSYPELKDLYELLKDQKFRPVRLDTKENYFHKEKTQVRARMRLGLQSLGLLTGLSAAAGTLVVTNDYMDLKHKVEADKVLESRMGECAEGLRFPVCEDSFCRTNLKDSTATFSSLVDRLQREVQEQYGVSPQLNLKPNIVDYLCSEAEGRDTLVEEADLKRYQLLKLMSGFLLDQRAFFTQAGYDLSRSHPYAQLWEERELILGAHPDGPELLEDPVYLGSFESTDGYSSTYHLWTDVDRSGVWASDFDGRPSRKAGVRAAREFQVVEQYATALPVLDFLENKHYEAMSRSAFIVEQRADVEKPCPVPQGRMMGGCYNEGPLWTDETTDDSYMFTLSRQINPLNDELENVILAKNPNDTKYSASRAVEGYKKLKDIHHSSWAVTN